MSSTDAPTTAPSDEPTCNPALREVYFAFGHLKLFINHPDRLARVANKFFGYEESITLRYHETFQRTWSAFSPLPPLFPTSTS
jgi:hypothetical protein